MHRTNLKVDEHLLWAESRQPQWKKLRTILLDGPLVKERKWVRVLAEDRQRKGIE